jgi:hypothetical protein
LFLDYFCVLLFSSDILSATASSGDSGEIPVPTLIVKWDDDLVTDEDCSMCLTAALPADSPAWTSLPHRFRRSFGLALEPEQGSGGGGRPGRYVLRSSESLSAKHPGFLPNTIVSNNLSSSPRPFWLHCVDAEQSLPASEAVGGMVFPGLPVAVRLYSESVMSPDSQRDADAADGDEGEEEAEARRQGEDFGGFEEWLDVPFTATSKLTDLKVLLVDSCQNVVNLKHLSDRVRDVTVQVSR